MATAIKRVPRVPRPGTVLAEGERVAAQSANAWWCPWDDRAMQHRDPCDQCGAVLDGGIAKRN